MCGVNACQETLGSSSLAATAATAAAPQVPAEAASLLTTAQCTQHPAGDHTPTIHDIFYPLLLRMQRWILHQFSRGKWGYFVLKECSYGSAPGDVWCNYPRQTGGAGRQLQGGRVQSGGHTVH